jgi:DnaJ like chaperone protein
MSWMTGAGLGFLLGGPLGAVVGGAMQHVLTKDARRSFSGSGPANQEGLFVTHLVAIMTKIAMADGRISPNEIRTIHDFFARELGYSGFELRFIDGLINQTRQVNPDMGEIAVNFRATNPREHSLLLLDICYRIAAADGAICAKEQHALSGLAETLGISDEERQRIQYKYSATGGRQHTGEQRPAPETMDDYAVLGVTSSASNDEIKKAYRQMASQYHPDKVSHLGKELIEFANSKFTEINSAYNNLRKVRRFQ